MSGQPSQRLLVVNSTEWLNLIARRGIRMAKRRVLTVGAAPTTKEMNRLFALAPFTNLDSSVDLFVLQVADTWPELAEKHAAAPAEVSWIDLGFVLQHHPVATKDVEYYQSIADKAGVSVSPAIFEAHWTEWVVTESLVAVDAAARTLQECLGVPAAESPKRTDKYSWLDVSRLVMQPSKPLRPKPSHMESLLSGVRQIADAVAEVRDSEAFLIASSIEWIDLRLKRDPLKKKSDRDFIKAALADVRSLPLDGAHPRTLEALAHLQAAFPRAFTDEITPMTVAGIVQLLSDYRSRRLKTMSVINAVDRIGRQTPGSTLLLSALAAALGPEFTYQLIDGMMTNYPTDVDWDRSGV